MPSGMHIRPADQTAYWSSPLTWVGIAAIALILVWQLIMPVAPDVAWLTTVSERMLDGERLYAQIFETNPPMAGLLYMLPVVFGRLFGVAADPLVTIQTVMLLALGVGLSTHLVWRHGLLSAPAAFLPIAVLLAGLSWGIEFGQREQYAVMALLPCLVAIAVRQSGRSLPWPLVLVLGLLGAFGTAIKPHFVLVLILPALWSAIRQRRIGPLFAPELLLAAIGFCGFWLWTALTFPDYFSLILPELADAYLVDRRPIWQLALNLPTASFLAFALLGLVQYRRDLSQSALLATLCVGSVAFFIIYLLQSKGFYYHAMPAFTLMALAVLLAMAARLGTDSAPIGRWLPIGVALVFSLLPQPDYVRVSLARDRLADVLRPYGPGLRLANITHEIRSAEPLARQVQAVYINSMPALINTLSAWRMRLDGVKDPAILARATRVEDLDRMRLRDDFLRLPPDVIITSIDGFDWIGWAAKDPVLATKLADYHEIGHVMFGDFKVLILGRAGLQPIR